MTPIVQVSRRSVLGAISALGLPALGAIGAALAKPQDVTIEPPVSRAYLDPSSDVEIDDLLDAWVDMYGRPTAKVMINGQGPFQFMVDGVDDDGDHQRASRAARNYVDRHRHGRRDDRLGRHAGRATRPGGLWGGNLGDAAHRRLPGIRPFERRRHPGHRHGC